MGMEERGDVKCFPEAWGTAAKPCDSCDAAPALLFCQVDSVFLCIGCDAKVHSTGRVVVGNARHERVWVCEVCKQAPATVTCKADAAALCVTCDRGIHSANPLAARHERLPVAPFYDTAESVLKSATAAFLLSVGNEITGFSAHRSCVADPETAPWVPPDPTHKIPAAESLDMKSVELLFSDSDPSLDFDYYPSIGIDSSGSDSVVPAQPMKSVQPITAQQMMNNPSPDEFLDIDFTSPKFGSTYNNNSSYAAQSLTPSFSSDVGIVPDGSCMSDISNPFGGFSSNGVDFGGSVSTARSQGTDRVARVMRYREKRKNRKFEKTIRYASRKAYAETRPRIKGRFAKRAELEPDFVNHFFNSGSSPVAVDAGYGVVPSFL